jgi:predicted phosphodiesterase
MKIALFSDIHANLPALEAFFEDVEKEIPTVFIAWAIW